MTSFMSDVPIGMQRLSCLPCRRRKSKCDRSQPCSSCVLRSTEKFCYTSTTEEELTPSSSSTRKEDRNRTNGAHVSPVTSASGRSAKVRRIGERGDGDGSPANAAGRAGGGHSPPKGNETDRQTEIDRSAMLSAINSIKTTLSDLEASLGQTEKANVEADRVVPDIRWEEIRCWLPSREDCETILDCFMTEATWLFSCIHQGQFMNAFRDFASGKAVPRTFAALLFFVMGIGLVLAPSSHPASRLSYQKDHKLFVERGHQVLLPSISPFTYIPNGADLMQAQTFLCYYMASNGWADQCYMELGKMLRYARAIHLFDEDKWEKSDLSDWDVELRRRMANDSLQLDRYLSMHFMRPPVMPLENQVGEATYYADECYDAKSGRLDPMNLKLLPSASYHHTKIKYSEGAHRTTHFLLNFLRKSPADRYQSAREAEACLAQLESQKVPDDILYERACNLSSLKSPEALRKACQALIIFTSIRRQRCTIMRQFLLDREAPVDLRVAALEHAKYIIETVPVLIAVSSSPWVAFSPSWCSGHLFCAASTFAIVYLGEEDHQDSSAELDWFASKIFEVLDTLSVLSVKDRVAKRCEELLIALCTSRDTLRAKFATSKNGMRKNFKDGQELSSTKAAAGSSQRKETWPGFRSVLPINDSGHLPHGIVNVADAPALSLAYPRSSAPITSSASTLFSSPEGFGAANTPAGASSGSRNSMTDDTPDSQTWWPPLDDGQWNALITSLDGDWSSLIGCGGGGGTMDQQAASNGGALFNSATTLSSMPTMLL